MTTVGKIAIFFLLTVLFLFTFLGCNSFSEIKNNFEDANYENVDDASEWIGPLQTYFETQSVLVSVRAFQSGTDVAIVLEFESVEIMDEQLENSRLLQDFLVNLEKADYVNGLFLLIPITDSEYMLDQIIEIFQGTYEIEGYYRG